MADSAFLTGEVDTRAQSEPIGVVVLTGIVVLSVATAGVVVFDQIQASETTRADVSVLLTHDGVSVSHDGGESVPLSALRVVVSNDSGTWEPGVDAAGVVDGDADGTFEPGERWVGRRSLAETVTTVYVFDNRTGTMLEKATRYPTRERRLTHTPSEMAAATTTPGGTPTPTPVATSPPTATATATPTPTATASSTSTATSTASPTATATATESPTPTTTASSTATDLEPTVDRLDVRSPGKDQTVVVDWRVSDDRGLENVTVRLLRNDSTVRTTTHLVTGTHAQDSDEYASLSPGTYRLVVVVADGAGQRDRAEETVTVEAGGSQGNASNQQGGGANSTDTGPPPHVQ